MPTGVTVSAHGSSYPWVPSQPSTPVSTHDSPRFILRGLSQGMAQPNLGHGRCPASAACPSRGGLASLDTLFAPARAANVSRNRSDFAVSEREHLDAEFGGFSQ